MPSPIVTATLQAAALSTASNVIAQMLEAHQEQRAFSLNLVQLIRFVALTLITAPPNYHWQQFLERTFPAYPKPRRSGRQLALEMKSLEEGTAVGQGGSLAEMQPKLSVKNTLTKWFVDCITLGALLNTLGFFIIMGIMKGQGLSQITSNIRTETIPLIVAGYKVWPLASIISFTFIPVHRRIVFLSFIGLIWGTYMSFVAVRV